MTSMHPFTLTFRDGALESAFARATFSRTRVQGRVAILIGIFVYLLAGGLDQWLVGPEVRDQMWLIRLTALCVPTVVLALSFTRWFERLCHPLLASVGLSAGVGIIGMQSYLSVEAAAYYYPLMVLVTFYTYNFVGTRFILALGVDLLLFASYNLVFGVGMAFPLDLLLTHDFYIVSANLIGGSAGYIAEHYRRVLFIRERELEAERQRHMTRSLHDPLTGLPNRDLLHDRIEQAIAEAGRSGLVHCGFFLDMNGFKAINDTLGHSTGDAVLQHVAQRLGAGVRSSDTVARIGGDEFFVLARDVGDVEGARALARSLLQQFEEPLPGVPEYIDVGASIGMCLFPYDGVSVEDLMHRTDQAMYGVKGARRCGYAMARTARDAGVDK